MSQMLKTPGLYTAEEFERFTESKAAEHTRYELIDGEIYAMAGASWEHQRCVLRLGGKLDAYFEGKPCQVGIAPYDVRLSEKNRSSKNVFQPDVFVVCDANKVTSKRLNGAPDWAIEIVSPSTVNHDYMRKLGPYMRCGVREYWIVDMAHQLVTIHYVAGDGEELTMDTYPMDAPVTSKLFPDLAVDFRTLNQ